MSSHRCDIYMLEKLISQARGTTAGRRVIEMAAHTVVVTRVFNMHTSLRSVKLEFHGSSFRIAFSPTRPTRATSSRGCYTGMSGVSGDSSN